MKLLDLLTAVLINVQCELEITFNGNISVLYLELTEIVNIK